MPAAKRYHKDKMEGHFRVAAAVLAERGRVLIAKRKQDGRFPGLWEFPGGKLEKGESPEACLERELREEMGIEIRVDALFCRTRYVSPAYEVELLSYRVTRLEGEIRLREHEEIRWVRPSELDDYEFTLPDRPVASRLKAGSAATSP